MSSRVVFHWVGHQRISTAKILSVLLLLSLMLAGQAAQPAHATGTTRFVKPSPTGLNTGSCLTWATACNLQRALAVVAVPNDQLWVMQGTYKPTARTVPADPRTATFVLRNSVKIYGGFAGTEIAFTQRNPVTHVTILSGAIGGASTGDNALHVVTAPGFVASTSTVLDGFTITAGNANGGGSNNYGGGMYSSGASPMLSNLTFSGNSAAGSGAGMFNVGGSNPTLKNVTFSGNSAAYGGGMYNIDNSRPTLTNVTFSGNSATAKGGGMYNFDSSPTLTNVTFSGNSAAAASGGAMYNDSDIPGPTSSPIIYDSIFWGDGTEIVSAISFLTIYDSIVSGTSCPSSSLSDCQDVLTSNPALGPLANNGGYTKTRALHAGSPAINAGDVWSTHCALTDQRGVKRPQGPACDMGAYEAPVTVSFESVGSQDGWIRESGENTSVGGGTPNSAGMTLMLGDDATRKQYRSILSFNTTALPNNATISSVQLKLKYSSWSPAATNPMPVLHGIMLDVRKGFFGTSALQLADFQQVPVGTVTIGPFSPGLSAGFYMITLSPASFTQINLLSTTQIRMRFQLDDNNDAIANTLNVASGDDPTTANRPTLIIAYITP